MVLVRQFANAHWALAGTLLLGCGSPEPVKKAEDERGKIGPAAPTYAYCMDLGYSAKTVNNVGSCVFPDGTACELWAFYYGKCGQGFSYCARQGGTLANETIMREGGTYTEAICTLKGARCNEQTFLKTKVCP
jgi:putative hemolysin